MSTPLGSRPVTLGSLALLATDSSGVDWVIEDVEGWSSAAIRSGMTDRQADHGAWASPVYLGSRPITLTGSIDAPDATSMDAAVEKLTAAVSLTDTLLVVGDSTPKQVTVRRSGEPMVERLGPFSAKYSILVTAADPRRYSTVLQSSSTGLPSTTGGLTLPITFPITFSSTTVSGKITLVNEGSIGTRPTLTVTGPATGFTIVAARPDGSTTQQTFTDTLGSGDVLVIDAAARSVVLNGSVSRRRYLFGTWLEIPPESQVELSWSSPSYDPSALLTGSCRSAWM